MSKLLFCALLFLSSCGGTYTYFKFENGGAEIYTSHKKGPQPYCQKVYGSTDLMSHWYGWQYCIISQCCTGIYFDTTGIHAREVEYAKQHNLKLQ